MNIYIKQVSHFLPKNKVSNQELIDQYGLRISDAAVKKVIGIESRYWAQEDISVSDMAVKACEKLDLKNFEGPIFLSTITGDYLSPSTSSIIKQKLGLKDTAPTFDINAACAGKIFTLDMAKNYLSGSQYDQAIVIASECRSRFTNKQDRKTAFLFADAASAVLLTKSKENDLGHIEWTDIKTKASEQFEIFIPGGGASNPEETPIISMQDGTKIKEVTTTLLINNVLETLEKNNQSLDNFDKFIFHQGNGRLILKIANELGIPEEKAVINFPKYGNSSSASVGVSLSEYIQSSEFSSNQRVLLMAMGAGYHIGMASIKWGEK